MCHSHIIDSIKQNVSQRGRPDLTPAVDPAWGCAGESLSKFDRVVDLTHTLTPNFPTYFGTPAFEVEEILSYSKDGVNIRRLSYAEHIGTHIDAPIHFSDDGQTVDQIPVERLVCPLVVIDVREKAASDRDYRLCPRDIAKFEDTYGEIPEGACVAMLSGWEQYIGSRDFRGVDESGVLHFPGIHLEAADFLLNERQVFGLGVDTLSLDFGPSKSSPVHNLWLPSGRYGIEGLANLAALPETGTTMVVGAPTFKGSTGGPCRVLALL